MKNKEGIGCRIPGAQSSIPSRFGLEGPMEWIAKLFWFLAKLTYFSITGLTARDIDGYLFDVFL